MSFLRTKSDLNIITAEQLVKDSVYAPSVHCSYFGCFQFLKYTIKKEKNITYDEIEENCKNYEGGTHKYIIETFLSECKRRIDFGKHKDLKRKIKDLKEFRILSDYFNQEVTIDEGEKSLSLSKEIIAETKQIFR